MAFIHVPTANMMTVTAASWMTSNTMYSVNDALRRRRVTPGGASSCCSVMANRSVARPDVTAFDPRRVKGNCERLLAVVLDDADVVPVLPDDVRAVSDFGGKGLGGEKHSDREGDTY